jgi:hypothetical protein
MLRGIFALCAGLFAAMIVYTVSAVVAMNLWPPTGVDVKDAAKVASFVAAMPDSARLTLLCGPLLGAFAGAGIGARMAAPSQQAFVASVLGALIAANTANDWRRVGHPQWMLVTGVVLSLLAALAATLIVRKAWPAPGR